MVKLFLLFHYTYLTKSVVGIVVEGGREDARLTEGAEEADAVAVADEEDHELVRDVPVEGIPYHAGAVRHRLRVQ